MAAGAPKLFPNAIIITVRLFYLLSLKTALHEKSKFSYIVTFFCTVIISLTFTYGSKLAGTFIQLELKLSF
jgi:hypothetical protein